MAEASGALEVVEDMETGNRFVPYMTSKGVELDCLFDGENPWFTQKDVAEMFGVTVQSAGQHIQRFIDDDELEEGTTKDFFIVRSEGGREVKRKVKHYSLDVAFYVGYRVNSTKGKLFRRWATNMLIQIATKGFVVQQRRLKGGENADRLRELREIIRDIRNEEANIYAELRNICAMCQDYDPDSPASRTFYQHMTAKLMYAVTSMTPAQVVDARANASEPNMGLQTWTGDRVLSSDVTTGKNYLAQGEMTELNRLTGILLDIFEDQIDIGRLTLMTECMDLLDDQLRNLGRVVLNKPGRPDKTTADRKAKEIYREFNERRRMALKAEQDREIAALKAAEKKLPKAKRKAPAKRVSKK